MDDVKLGGPLKALQLIPCDPAIEEALRDVPVASCPISTKNSRRIKQRHGRAIQWTPRGCPENQPDQQPRKKQQTLARNVAFYIQPLR